MVTCSSVVDGGRWNEGQAELELARNVKSAAPAGRALVYDVETGSLRYSKLNLKSRSPISPRSLPCSSFIEASNEQLGAETVVDSKSTTPLISKHLHCELGFTESGESSPTCVIQNSALRSNSSSPTISTISKASSESSPTCVIQNSALRSNSSSPTMSTISKASSDPGRQSQDTEPGGYTGTKLLPRVATTSPPELDEEVITSGAKSPRLELQKIGDVRERIKTLESINTTSGRPGLKEPPPPRRVPENDATITKENNWSSMPHHDEVKNSTLTNYSNPPFKSIQCAVADHSKTNYNETAKKSKHGGIPVSRLAGSQSASIMHKSPGIFSFDATYISDLDDFNVDHGDGTTPKVQLDLSRRTFLPPLLKPTPSKWDDAEKWLPGSHECQSARAVKSRSGPLLAQMVAAQAGMSIPSWKAAGPQIVTSGQHTLGVAVGERRRGEAAAVEGDSGSDIVDVKNVQTLEGASKTVVTSNELVDFTADEKQQLNLLLDRYAVEIVGSQGGLSGDGGTSPSCLNGSFLKLAGARMEKPLVVEFSPTMEDYNSGEVDNLKLNFTRAAVSTRDMGTAMTPIASVEPSRTSTPLRATTNVKRPDNNHVQVINSLEQNSKKGATETTSNIKKAKTSYESPRVMMTEKELQEKTRQEIVALGTQLGKANIAAAWAAREKEKESSAAAVVRSSSALDLENIRREVFASRADAWQEAEKAKYTSRFEQEQAKIKAWEEHEKAKAEAEMCRVEIMAERMKSQAHEKLAHKLATARRQAEQLRLAAETWRAEAAAKATRKAEILKTNGKITNFLFLSYLCT